MHNFHRLTFVMPPSPLSLHLGQLTLPCLHTYHLAQHFTCFCFSNQENPHLFRQPEVMPIIVNCPWQKTNPMTEILSTARHLYSVSYMLLHRLSPKIYVHNISVDVTLLNVQVAPFRVTCYVCYLGTGHHLLVYVTTVTS